MPPTQSQEAAMCRAILFLAVLAVSIPMPASAEGPNEPIKAMGQMTREGLLIEYIVVSYRRATRARGVKLPDGTTKTETYNIDVPVLENREMLLTKFEVTKLDGSKVAKEVFAGKMKAKAPLLLQPGQVSQRDQQFYRADLFVAVNLDPDIHRKD
jgi:hypothetical protein